MGECGATIAGGGEGPVDSSVQIFHTERWFGRVWAGNRIGGTRRHGGYRSWLEPWLLVCGRKRKEVAFFSERGAL